MSEEQKDRRLSEEELNAVGGGFDDDVARAAYLNYRMNVCPTCRHGWGGDCPIYGLGYRDIREAIKRGVDPSQAACTKYQKG